MRRERIAWPHHEAPDAAAVDAIHRGHDAWVIICRKDAGGGWHERYSHIRASDLRDMFPAIAQELLSDSYYTVNGFFTPWRRHSTLRYLTCAYADLDCYRVGLTTGQAFGLIVDAQDAGLIPPATIVGRSGRGLWLFWRLHEEGHLITSPVRAWPERVELWARIQRAIFQRLATIGADAQARDAARVTRIPGSQHSGTGEQVSYWLQTDRKGQAFEYTLRDLADFFGVSTETRIPANVRTSEADPVLSEYGRSGWRELHAKRLRQLITLQELRGGFRQGCRNRAALLLAMFLRAQREPEATITAHVRTLGRRCVPPLTPAECDAAVVSSRQLRRIGDETISDWLDITPAESELLESWRPALAYLAAVRPLAPSRAEAAALRRAFIRQLCDERGTVPPLQELATLIEQETGIRAERETIRQDCRALGIANPRARKPKPPAPDPLPL